MARLARVALPGDPQGYEPWLPVTLRNPPARAQTLSVGLAATSPTPLTTSAVLSIPPSVTTPNNSASRTLLSTTGRVTAPLPTATSLTHSSALSLVRLCSAVSFWLP